MIILACESSTLLGSVAVFENSKLIAYKESLRQGSHSDVLNLFVEQVLATTNLKISDIDLFISGIGPGSFTGIRISITTIKTFAYCFDKPVLGINSLENLAWQYCLQCDDEKKPIISMINAYKNMVYIATYKKENSQLVTLKEPEVVRVQNLDQYITEAAICVGDGYTTYSKYFNSTLNGLITRPSFPEDDPKASAAAYFVNHKNLKSFHWSLLLPLYLRASEAEENLNGIKFQPLE
ncbi:MAG: tRNA (adenosine(37)-N6)-threonylcarbamoyltransferase complex dimerization subunit type 1 TsaB [Pseudobdellovibrio sp.]